MREKKSVLNIITITLLLSLYIGNFLHIGTSLNGLIVAFSLLTIFLFWSLKKTIKFKYSELISLVITLSLVVLTVRLNYISLSLLIILSIIVKNNTEDIESAIKTYSIVSITFFIITLAMYFFANFNAQNDVVMWRIDRLISRNSLGFVHPNQAMITWLGFALSCLARATYKNAIFITTITIASTYLIYQFAQSRTSTYVLIGISILIFLTRKSLNKKLPSFLHKLLAISPVIFLSISLVPVMVPYNPYLDVLFSGRLRLYNLFYSEYGIKLLGSVNLEEAMFDNGYLQALLSKGLLFTILFISIFIILILKNKNIKIIDSIIILGFLTSGVTETVLFKFELLFLIVLIIYRRNNELGKFDKKV